MIVTAGKAGAGKSTLVNNFLELTSDAGCKACLGPNSVTTKVDYFDREIHDVKVRVIDMPGFYAADSGVITDKKKYILGELKGVTKKGVDVVFYCINLLHRLENVDYENLDTLHKEFGSDIWEHVIFVFTRTDTVMCEGDDPKILIEEYIEVLQKHLGKKKTIEEWRNMIRRFLSR